MMMTEYCQKRLEMLNEAEKGRTNPEYGTLLVEQAKIKDRDYYNGNLEKSIDNCISEFCPTIKGEARMELKNDVWRARVLNLIDPEEYFLYDFASKNEDERHQFVGNREKELLCSIINSNDAWKIFMNKWETYQCFKSFFKRDAIHIMDFSEKNNYLQFVNEHRKVVIKKTVSSKGVGVFFGDADTNLDHDYSGWIRVSQILSEGSTVIVEECIQQVPELAAFHPNSVNTVRFATFFDGNDVIKMMCVLRMGKGDSNVDNGGSGGICAAVDLNTGVCKYPGVTEKGERYFVHPDSRERITGFTIPKWSELLETVNQLARVIPEQKYVGWDLSLTKKGWVMIEGNSWGQFEIGQMSSKIGMRDIINNTFGHYIKT